MVVATQSDDLTILEMNIFEVLKNREILKILYP